MMGKRALEAAHILVDELQIPLSPEEYLALREPRQNELFGECKALPGAIRLVKYLSKHNIPQSVATSSHSSSFAIKTKLHMAWFSHFPVIVKGDDPEVKRGKPFPDIFLEAAKRMGATDMSKCLVLEDAPAGVEAAIAAGMKVVAIPDPNMEKEQFSQAHQVLASLSEFSPEQWGLPPYTEEDTDLII
eukprot:TRINITY_DN9194_c0_g1_i1.p1 TRINITY_DN9194_c0_g1~~TRINITY_DN9194_c0_g1_i1.p1  ORF type:complete len:188 (+),score=28.32 TRINITY_DN9194_c0_g1_i1:250-813(+)